VLAVIPEGLEAGYAALKGPEVESGTETAVVFVFTARGLRPDNPRNQAKL
jgi:hypothetical protein